MKHLTQASHPYLQRVQRETTKMIRNDGGNRQENLKRKKYLHKASTINQGSYLTIYFFFERTPSNGHITLILVVTNNSCISTCASIST